MNNRIYLDYNSTSPLAKSVIDFLAKGDFPFANPASIHKSGKQSRKLINQVTNQIFKTFGLDFKVYDLIYHSGATEFINTFFQFGPNDAFLYSPADHKASLMQGEKCKYAYPMLLDENGLINYDHLKELIRKHLDEHPNSRIMINFQWVNSETGIVQNLKEITKLKAPNVYIHVDAVQSPAKIPQWNELDEYADAYSYSAHKFGALKGVGFSFCKVGFPLNPLILGGDQQASRRAGTENPLGVLSIGMALEELKDYPMQEVLSLKKEIIKCINSNERLQLIGKIEHTNVNTICFIDKNNRADGNLIKFDMQGLDISSGSACTAGSIQPSPSLQALGYSEYAHNGLRISLGPENVKQADEVFKKLTNIISKL